MKKGVFYTVGFFLLAGIILSLAIIVFRNFNYSQERFNEVIVLDNIYEIDKSIQEGFRDIFNLKSGIIINKGESVSFSENLPNNNKNEFNSELEKYKVFLESNLSVSFNINDTKNRLPLRIIPHQIEYYHENFGDSKIRVDAQSPNFDGYTITINTNSILDSNSCSLSGQDQLVYLGLVVYGLDSSCSVTENKRGNIDLRDSNNNLIASINLNGDDLTITGYNEIRVTTSINNLTYLGGAHILLPKGMIFLDYNEFNIVKNSTIMLM